MKFTLREIKINLQGTNRGGTDVKNQINDLEHKGGKAFKHNSKKKKKNSEKQGQHKQPLGHLHMHQHLNHKGATSR